MAVGVYLPALAVILTASLDLVSTQVLTPPYFNLAVSRHIEATATCGEGVAERELFCKLTGANPGRSQNAIKGNFEVIQGQLCDFCDSSDPSKVHPPEYAIDGTERWWQSPPLSRGLRYNEVNLTINLGQTFHVAYVFIKMGNSPRPGVFVLERSIDGGETWKPWQYFADTKSDCNTFFGQENYEEYITRDDSIICTTEYSKVVPLEGGEIVVSLVNDRPSANNFSYSQTLRDWTKATNLRLRLLRTKTLLGHLMAVARQDPTITRRYYYSIKDISIGGRCVCNGHADVCDKTDPIEPYKLLCRCQHNTCGDQCQTCCPGFVQKPWKPATLMDINECEPCQCYGHTQECMYNEEVAANHSSIDIHGNYDGGGVCQNCQHNTMGINCQKCKPGYYRPHGVLLNATDVCQPCRCDPFFSTGECEEGTGRCFCKPQFTGPSCEQCSIGYYGWPRCLPCDCNVNGTVDQVCEVGGGQCPCKRNYEGVNCDQCAPGYYGFPECKPCNCNPQGSLSSFCEPFTGQCSCRSNYGTRDCSGCARGHYNYPLCDLCSCEPNGATEEICEEDTGRCLCLDNYDGYRCEQCASGFYSYPNCIECGCAEPGSQSERCDNSGQCVCNYNYAGRLCDRCAPGYYKYPECLPCNCDPYGAYGVSCDQETGQCECKFTFEGQMCEKCKENYYNYPICEECNCNPAGAKEVAGYPLGGCGATNDGRLCECKDRVTGRICDSCLAGYWNLNANNPFGCEDCNCYIAGTTGSSHVCDVGSGQCFCKPYVTGRTCDACVDGTYSLAEHSPFGCIDCECDPGGSVDSRCDKGTGQCTCRPRVNGRTCNRPIATHYFPTLYHLMYEFEDGRTKEGGRVRYGFDENVFYDFSWRGYAIYSRLQDEVLVDVNVAKPSLYRIIFRYVNPTDNRIVADVSLLPATSVDIEQTSEVIFEPSMDPEFVTVAGGGVSTTFVLNPGKWTVSLKTKEQLYVDYVVLLPQEYYEASILQDVVNNPCLVPADDQLCKHFIYVDISTFSSAPGENGYIRVGNDRERTQLFDDRAVTDQLGSTNMALIDAKQPSMMLNLPVSAPGQYVLVMVYHSGQLVGINNLEVDVASPGARETGYLSLHGCPYSSLCRQMVTDVDGKLAVFNIDGAYASLTITGSDDINVAIDSIVAIPVEDWNLSLIQPHLKCIRQNQKCIASLFYNPTGSIQVEAESGSNEDLVSSDIPPNIIDTTVRVIKMDQDLPAISLNAAVTNPGQYVLVAHYYQPYSIPFDVEVEVLVNGVIRDGTLRIDYCPSDSGCRAVIKFEDAPDMQVVDLIDLDFVIAFNSTSINAVWIDYIIVVPADSFSPNVLDVQGVDKSGEFIAKCGQNDFYISPSATGFCRDAVYSLTTYYNNGAHQCSCNPDGSTSFKCEEFGGQCYCKSHIIGRTCSQCRTGYFGFPNCRPCNCPSGLCDPVSGQCVCPPRVTGANCNVCLPQTFGYDPFIGCEECNCNRMGVQDDNMDCNVEHGQCNCKPNVGGRRCDKCLPGYYGYPRCSPCSCDPDGTTEEICDQDTAQCLCRENVVGPQCTECKANTFYLEDRNPLGCTTCFCFNLADRCESSTYRWSEVIDMEAWGLTNLAQPRPFISGNTVEARIDPVQIINPDVPIYWVAPLLYLGNKVTSYGGKLRYTISFRLPRDGQYNGLVNPDVRIEGNNFTLAWISPQQPAEGIPLTVELDLLESQFIHESTGAFVTRDQFMMVLQNIDALQIRGSFYTQVIQVKLGDVHLDVASPDGYGDIAKSVEQCACPANYKGTSCEECVDGYYRSITGPYLGVCVPCQCNNKADRCDPETGECVDCKDNYSGPNCLTCMKGHYEDPYTRTCQPCSCPLPVPSNNFASTCQVASDGSMIQCMCEEGYSGRQCEICDIGYYGNPAELGGRCQPCECSGNIDLNDPLSCDIVTGECLKCVNNSGGDRCQYCAEWYWGDAVYEKNCQPCDCDQTGSESCDPYSGVCLCKPNVVGPRCDQCAPEAFGFESGIGCQLCDCAVGSYSGDCDLYTGQCSCKPGVTGRRCDVCERNYWNYGSNGCQSCHCEFEGATTCDPYTGRCQCLPGVTGDKCDQCLDRWVLIPDQGCIECDNCIHLLLDDMEFIDVNVTNMIEELESVSVGQGAIRKLEEFNRTVHELRPQVDSMINDPTDPSLLDPLKAELLTTTRRSNEVRGKADRAVREAQLVEDDASVLKVFAEELNPLVLDAMDVAESAVDFVKEVLRDIVSGIEDKNVEELLRQAESILQDIVSKNFYDARQRSMDEVEKAMEVLHRAQAVHQQALEQANRTETLSVDLTDVFEKLQDLMNNSRHSMDNTQSSNGFVFRSRELLNEIKAMIGQLKATRAATESCVEESQALLSNGTQFLQDAQAAFLEMEAESSRLDGAMEDLRTYVDNLNEENIDLRPLVDKATAHAHRLWNQAQLLESLISDTKSSAEGALNASHAYQSIVDAINQALNASQEAIKAAEKAMDLSNGLADRARSSFDTSLTLKTDADDTLAKVSQELKPRVDSAVHKTIQVEDLNNEASATLSDMLLTLEGLPEGGYGQRARDAAEAAITAQAKAESARSKIQAITKQLPKDQSRMEQIPRMIAEANVNVMRSQGAVDSVIALVPQATRLLDTLSVHAESVNAVGQQLIANISALRDQIQVARDQSNLIEVGMTFDHETTLRVRNPVNLQQAASYSKLSMYIKTKQADGFLAYVGPDRYSSQQEDDYMALEVVNGLVVFRYDLGDGPGIITNSKSVNDGKWHEVIAERTGKIATVTVRTAAEDDVQSEGVSPGTFSVLDLNPLTAKFYIGGAPGSAGLESLMNSIRFGGCIENVDFGGVPVGLWNLEGGTKNLGCTARDALTGVSAKGFRFDGTGYVIIEKQRFNPTTSAQVTLTFKTFNPNGLLFVMGDAPAFYSIELKNGKVLFQYDLGSGAASLESTGNKTYNDGQWHTVVANRIRKDGILKVDADAVMGRSAGRLQELSVTEYLYFGGFKGTHSYRGVTQQGFEGCIKDVSLGSGSFDINNDNVEARGVLPGCPEMARVISFDPKATESYLALESINVDQNFQMTMKIKAETDDGLLFYTADETPEQANSLSVSLVKGKINVIAVSDGTKTILETHATSYNDGGWHYITVTKASRDLQVDVDDLEMVKTKIEGKRRIKTSIPLYLGGVPRLQNVVPENVGARNHFAGCIGDVTINGRFVNFALIDPANNVGGALTACPIPDPTPVPTASPTMHPDLDFTPTGTSPVQCVLPRHPASAEGDPSVMGVRYGMQQGSRSEFDTLPASISSRFDFSVELRTSASDGVIFYTADATQTDFVALYMKNGQLVYAFNCGSGTAVIMSDMTYNDNQWHKVVFSRDQKSGQMVINDGEETKTGESGGTSNTVNVVVPYSLGGLYSETAQAALKNLDGVTTGFIGCLRGLSLNDQSLVNPSYEVAVEPCSAEVEEGTFFYAEGGYLTLDDKFSVGLDLEIYMEVRPRSGSGILLSVHGAQGDYLILQMVNGEVIINVDNGEGEIMTTYSPPLRNQLCDGHWHTIEALKTKNVVTLTVDSVPTFPGIGPAGVSETNTADPLYLGGAPGLQRGMKTDQQYVGCIRNIKLGGERQNLASAEGTGKVSLNTCPTN